MEDEFLTTRAAARRLGVSAATLYDWLGRSDRGQFVLRGQTVTIDYLQGGPRGQGRIRIPAREVARLQALMRVRPQESIARRLPTPAHIYPGINVPLGRPH